MVTDVLMQLPLCSQYACPESEGAGNLLENVAREPGSSCQRRVQCIRLQQVGRGSPIASRRMPKASIVVMLGDGKGVFRSKSQSARTRQRGVVWQGAQ